MRPISRLLTLPLLLAALAPAAAAAQYVVALVGDGPSRQGDEIRAVFRREILALTVGEIAVEFRDFDGAWSRDSILGAMDRAYGDPEVDLVLVTGLVGNQIAGVRDGFPKPTFLPIVFDAGLIGLPRAERGSGEPNLAYLTDDIDFAVDLGHFLEVVDFEHLGILVDGIILDAVGATFTAEAGRIAADRGVELVLVPYDDPEGDLGARIPPAVDAVMVGGLERLDEAAVERLIEALIARQLPSFCLAGEALVRRGFLTTSAAESDWQRLARTAALQVQAVMLGDKAEDQPVELEAKRRIYLNLETARAIDVWPRYATLVEAVVVGAEPGGEGSGLAGQTWTLAAVAAEAVAANLALLAETYGTEAGAEDVRAARAALLPQLTADLSSTQLDGGSPAVASGAAAERSTRGALTVRQTLWSEAARANRAIQERLQESREAELRSFRLDTVELATVAFLDILRAETQVRVQRDNVELTRANLDLARDRVRLGSSSAADVYRWQSELATAQQSAIAAFSGRSRARENLNRLLHRPLTEPFRLQPPTLDDPSLLFAEGELGPLIDSPKAFRALTEYLVAVGVERAPELAALAAALGAKEREILAARRAFTLPTVSLQGQLDRVLEEDRKAGVPLDGETDWSLGLVATLPLYSGGSRRSAMARAELERKALETRYASARELVEQDIRSSLHLANASYNSISLARQGAEAAAKNLELVTDSYSQGAVSILDLLDAQSAALRAEQGAANAVYDFLIDLMNVERAIGRFDFFLDDPERRSSLAALKRFLANGDRNDE